MGSKPIYAQRAKALGEWIAQNGNCLVYGGGSVGLMGLVADTVLENGGTVIGVIPKFLESREMGHSNLTELLLVETMSERKQKIAELGEAFIALPGGLGTLEEISEVMSWARIGQNNSPCILFNVEGYYNNLAAMLDTMVENKFLGDVYRDKYLFSDNFVEISNFIAHYEVPEVRKY